MKGIDRIVRLIYMVRETQVVPVITAPPIALLEYFSVAVVKYRKMTDGGKEGYTVVSSTGEAFSTPNYRPKYVEPCSISVPGFFDSVSILSTKVSENQVAGFETVLSFPDWQGKQQTLESFFSETDLRRLCVIEDQSIEESLLDMLEALS